MKLIAKDPGSQEEILTSSNKLVDQGYSVREADLPKEIADKIDTIGGSGYYMPLRTVRKQTSLSTPTRIVYDASSCSTKATAAHANESLINILAKGQNTLMKILDILLRVRVKKYCFTCDINMCYNNIRLEPEYF